MKSPREQLDDANTRRREAGELRIDNGTVPQEIPSDCERTFPDGEQWGSDLSGDATRSEPAATDAKGQQPPRKRQGVYKWAADIEETSVEWLWPGRFPLAMITVLAGQQGLGKSFVTHSMATSISTGRPWPDTPDAANQVGSVLIMNTEDKASSTTVPRLRVAGADMARVAIFRGIEVEGRTGLDPLYIEEDIDIMRGMVERITKERGAVRLLTIDPFMDFVGSRTDIHRDNDVRAMLVPLARLAEEVGIAIVPVMHLRKSGTDAALYRVLGSVALTSVARSVQMVGNLPGSDDKRARVLVSSKLNVGLAADALGFSIVPYEPEPKHGRLVWSPDPVDATADEVFAAGGGTYSDESAPQVAAAAEWLLDALADGSVDAKEIKRQAAANSIAARTLDRARRKAGAITQKDGFAGKWRWSLPDSAEGAE